jgi:hypothetical protein
MRKILLIALCLPLVWSCKKEDEADSAAPVIAFKAISHTEVEEFTNNISITFAFEDFQGDIGYSDNDQLSLRVKDSRLEAEDWYHVPPMTPNLQELHIKGEYSVELNPLFLLGNGAHETTTFTLQLKDREGNWSNQIVTPDVLINDTP